MNGSRLTVGSLFSGIGLLDYGLTLAGFDHQWFCEGDEWRRSILAKRWPGATVYPDIRELSNPPRVGMVAGGFPCKGVSYAGPGTGFDHPETRLWREMWRVIREVGPRYVLVENVAALTSQHDGRLIGEVLRDLAEGGFGVWWDCLPASSIGAPHGRDRILLVAHADEQRVQGGRNGRGADQAEARIGSSPYPDLQRREEPHRSEPREPALTGAAHDSAPASHPNGEPAQLGGRPRAVAGAHREAEGDGEQRQRGRETSGDRAEAPTDPQELTQREQADEAHPEPRGGNARQVPDRGTPLAGFDWFRGSEYEACVERWAQVFEAPPIPLVHRMDDGPPAGVERSRLSALGDGVQVQVGEAVGRRILKHEGALTP